MALGYAGAVVWLINQETRLLVQASSSLAGTRPPFPYEQIDLPRADGKRQFAWSIRTGDADAGPWVLYLHGNATTIASHVNIAHYRLLRGLGMHTLAPEYRGFGGLDGLPNETTLQEDARAAYDYLRETRRIPPHQIVIYGWSLGSAVAIDLASRVPPAAMILEGAPASLVEMTARRYPFFPIRLLMRSEFDSLRRIRRIPAPMLFLHSVDDEVIPISEGRRLFEAAGGAKLFVELRGGHMSAIDADAARYEEAIRAFLARHRFISIAQGS